MRKTRLVGRLNMRRESLTTIRNNLLAALGNIPCIAELDLTIVVLDDLIARIVAEPLEDDLPRNN
jgi:hypothetical protein